MQKGSTTIENPKEAPKTQTSSADSHNGGKIKAPPKTPDRKRK